MRRFNLFYQFVLLLGIFSSCSITKYVPDGKQLLVKNSIELNRESISAKKNSFSIDQLNAIVKQQPNRKILIGFPFHLRLYNLSNQKRIDKRVPKKYAKTEKINKRIELRNQKKIAKNPSYQPQMSKSRALTFGEKLRSAGEEPVVVDENLTEQSSKQLSTYLTKKGYFNNNVSDSTYSKKNRKKAVVSYTINLGQPYRLNSIEYKISDSILSLFIDSIKQNSQLKEGINFDTDVLDLERDRITAYLLNSGYHYFNKEFVFFKADTSVGENKVDLVLSVQNYKHKAGFSKNPIEMEHKRYKISTIHFRLTPGFSSDYIDTSRIRFQDIDISYSKKLVCKPEMLLKQLKFKIGDFYSKKNTEDSYRKLSNLGIFDKVSIKFDSSSYSNGLSVFIDLVESKSQTLSLSTDGTHNEGLLGVEGRLTYAHRNLFNGAEHFSISLTGGVESQLLFTESNDSLSSLNSILFNTIEFGPNVSFSLPKYLFINKLKFLRNHSSGRTEFTASLNYQRRPDFTRTMQELSFGWYFHEKKTISWHINPLIISAIDITKDPDFEQQIEELNDQFIQASFQDHIIAGGFYSFEYNGQNDREINNVFYFKAVLETAGGLLYRTHKLLNRPVDNNSTNSFDLLGIRYAHFQKISTDLRYYVPIGLRSKLVYRLAGGIGVPRENLSEALPFEKSFFSGGANGMRAWRARSLGPGSYYDEQNRFDKIGDIQLEGNVEFRFPLISWFEGALFLDAGNVWLINDDPLRPGGKFSSNFINELAIGSGVGIRMDLEFFIIRMDFGIPLRNPAIQMNDSSNEFKPWIFNSYNSSANENNRFFRPQFNLGIGYPF